MIGRDPGPQWSTLRKGDVLVSSLAFWKQWTVIVVLEDAQYSHSLTGEGTRTFHIGTMNNGVHYIRTDDAEISSREWDVIRAT